MLVCISPPEPFEPAAICCVRKPSTSDRATASVRCVRVCGALYGVTFGFNCGGADGGKVHYWLMEAELENRRLLSCGSTGPALFRLDRGLHGAWPVWDDEVRGAGTQSEQVECQCSTALHRIAAWCWVSPRATTVEQSVTFSPEFTSCLRALLRFGSCAHVCHTAGSFPWPCGSPPSLQRRSATSDGVF
jgi:hypothetical protein